MLKPKNHVVLVIGNNHEGDVNRLVENGVFSHGKCYQTRLITQGEEGPLSTPLTTNNGGRSYSSKKGDIDFSKHHKNRESVKMYNRLWDMLRNGDQPQTQSEERMYRLMKSRTKYMDDHFKSHDMYINYNTNLWYWGVVKDGEYISVSDISENSDWIENFYDKFIDNLMDNEVISIYEVSLA